MRHVSFLLAPVFACGLVIAACTSSDAETVTIEERDGVVYVENRGEGLWDGDAPVHFELEQVFGVEAEPEEAVLAGVASMAVDSDENLYVLDRQNHRIISFYSDGTVRWAAGREGEGPGEFSLPSSLAWDGEEGLFVTNQSGRQLDVWSTEGVFEMSYSLDDVARSFVQVVDFTPPSTLTLSASEVEQIGSWIIVAELDEQIRESHAFFIEQHPSPELEPGMGATMGTEVGNGMVLSGYNEHYRVEAYDLEGNLQRVITRPEVDYLMPPAVEVSSDGARMRMLGGVISPMWLTSDIWMVQARWPTNLRRPEDAFDMEGDEVEFARTIDFFDNEGRFIGSVEQAAIGFEKNEHPRAVGPDGSLYTYTEAPYPQVRRYRVAID